MTDFDHEPEYDRDDLIAALEDRNEGKGPMPRHNNAPDWVSCRANISPACEDGTERSLRDIEEIGEWRDDGTYQAQPHESIICDACYLALLPLTPSGRGLTHELQEAIDRAKDARP